MSREPHAHSHFRQPPARRLIEIANGVEPAQDGGIYIERVNAPFLAAGGTSAPGSSTPSR
jgi:hypothetical protein